MPIGAALLTVLIVVTLASRPDGQLHLTVLDIGQGDAILVETPTGATMLVDGGPDPELTLRRLGANLPFFARRIDVMVVSHPHQDHVAGLVEVLDRFRVGLLLHAGIPFENPANDQLLADATSEPMLAAAHARAGQSAHARPDDDGRDPLSDRGRCRRATSRRRHQQRLGGDGAPPRRLHRAADRRRGGTGGGAAARPRGICRWSTCSRSGHHGSNSSTTPGLVDAVRPTAAIISSGEGNEYGHPAPETLATLAARPEIAVFRTDLDGDVEVVSDGRSYRVRTDAGWIAPRPVHGAPAHG